MILDRTRMGMIVTIVLVVALIGMPAISSLNASHSSQPPASPSPFSVSLSSDQVTGGILFAVNVSGGQSPYAYEWFLNGSPVAGAVNGSYMLHLLSPSLGPLSLTVVTVLNYTVSVKVTDGLNDSAFAHAVIQYPSVSPPYSLPNYLFIVSIVGMLVAVTGGLILYARSKRDHAGQ